MAAKRKVLITRGHGLDPYAEGLNLELATPAEAREILKPKGGANVAY